MGIRAPRRRRSPWPRRPRSHRRAPPIVGARNLLSGQADQAATRHSQVLGHPAARRRRVHPRRRAGRALAPRGAVRPAPDDLRRLHRHRIRLPERRRSAGVLIARGPGRAVRQAHPAEHQGDRRRHVEGPVGPDRRHVRGRPAAGCGGDHDRRQRRHQRSTASARRRAGWAMRSHGCAPAVPWWWSGTCPDFGVITAIPQPLRWVARDRGLRLARAQAAAVRAAGGVPVPLADLLTPEFRQAPEVLFSAGHVPPVGRRICAGGQAAAARAVQCAGRVIGRLRARAGVGVADRPSRSAVARRVGVCQPAVAALDRGPRTASSCPAELGSSARRLDQLRTLVEEPSCLKPSSSRPPARRSAAPCKGSLVDMRPDDLAAQMVRAALDKVPALDPREIDDLMHGLRPARRRGRLQHRPRGRRRAGLRLPARAPR